MLQSPSRAYYWVVWISLLESVIISVTSIFVVPRKTEAKNHIQIQNLFRSCIHQTWPWHTYPSYLWSNKTPFPYDSDIVHNVFEAETNVKAAHNLILISCIDDLRFQPFLVQYCRQNRYIAINRIATNNDAGTMLRDLSSDTTHTRTKTPAITALTSTKPFSTRSYPMPELWSLSIAGTNVAKSRSCFRFSVQELNCKWIKQLFYPRLIATASGIEDTVFAQSKRKRIVAQAFVDGYY